MKTNQNSTAYIGTVSLVNGENEEIAELYENTLQPSLSNDPILLRKLACEMILQCIENINSSEDLKLNATIICINTETDISYPVFSITGQCDIIEVVLENEINILIGEEQMRVDAQTLLIEKESMPESNKKTPKRSVRMQTVGFEYPNKN
jgi:hypothetical protein